MTDAYEEKYGIDGVIGVYNKQFASANEYIEVYGDNASSCLGAYLRRTFAEKMIAELKEIMSEGGNIEVKNHFQLGSHPDHNPIIKDDDVKAAIGVYREQNPKPERRPNSGLSNGKIPAPVHGRT